MVSSIGAKLDELLHISGAWHLLLLGNFPVDPEAELQPHLHFISKMR